MSSTVVSTLDGVSFGMVLFFVAAGLSLIMGVMRILNLAHGAFYMIGGYLGWSIAVSAGGGFWLGVVGAGLAVTGLGVVVERLMLRRMRLALDNQVLATLGLLYITTNVVIWIWSGEPKAPLIPALLNQSVNVVGQRYQVERFAVIGAGLVIASLLWLLQSRTMWGARLRAGIDDRDVAMSTGINVDRVSLVVFAVGAFLAGAGGMIGQQFTGLVSTQGTDMLLLALVVVIVGGVGKIEGTLVGAVVIGLVNSFGQRFLPNLAPYLVYIVMIIVLVVRPVGILGRIDLGRL